MKLVSGTFGGSPIVSSMYICESSSTGIIPKLGTAGDQHRTAQSN